MTPNLSPFTNYIKPGFAKIAPWWLARKDNLSAKEPGQLTGVTAPPTLSTYTHGSLAQIVFGVIGLAPRFIGLILTLNFSSSGLKSPPQLHCRQMILATIFPVPGEIYLPANPGQFLLKLLVLTLRAS